MKKNSWKAYNDLAWTELVLCSVEDCAEEIEFYRKAIMENARNASHTLLHLGCGAGIHDYTFKQYFTVTGVDLSEGMLSIARDLNSDVTYLHGDMRTIQLPNTYDVVAIPDSIGYLLTKHDLQQTISNAYHHLRAGGVLLIVAQIREEFTENNFVYTGSKDDICITLFENNYLPCPGSDRYEATLTYLIRQKGQLTIVNECHLLGLFALATWVRLLEDVGFVVKQEKVNDLYDQYIMGEGAYPQTLFVCVKPLS